MYNRASSDLSKYLGSLAIFIQNIEIWELQEGFRYYLYQALIFLNNYALFTKEDIQTGN